MELKMDFPYEDILIDCMVFSILAEESNMRSRQEKISGGQIEKSERVEKILINFLQVPIPEVRERILRKIYQRIKISSKIVEVNKHLPNNALFLAKFVYRKAVAQQLVTGLFID